MKKILSVLTIGCLTLVACGQNPKDISTTRQDLGSLELTLGSDGLVGTSRLVRSGLQAQGTIRENDVTFTALNSAAVASDGDYDYIQVQFVINNNSSSSFNNLTLYAVAKENNVAGTALKNLTDFGGTATADQDLTARLTVPTHGLNLSGINLSLAAGREDFQAFTPAEIAEVQADPAFTAAGFSSNDTVLPYGFVAKRCPVAVCTSPTTPYNRSIGSTGKGIITLAYRIPRPSSGASGAYRFTATFVVVNEPITRVTRSLIPAETVAAADSRLNNIGGSATRELMQFGSDRPSSTFAAFVNLGVDAVSVSKYGFQGIEAGAGHTCGVTAQGKGYCWGYNGNSQLGDGGSTNSNIPKAIADASTGALAFSSISAGLFHTCGLTTTGKAYCWGEGGNGRLGTGSTSSVSIPTAVADVDRNGTLETYSSISAGGRRTCATGRVLSSSYCWGSNENSDSNVPLFIFGDMRPIHNENNHTCGIRLADKKVFCWGNNQFGQLGNGNAVSDDQPTRISDILTFLDISAGELHSCGLTIAGAAYCWGRNNSGQLGNGSNSTSRILTPAAIADHPTEGAIIFSSISANTSSCGVSTSGKGYCWGGNFNGELGTGNNTNSNVPARVLGNQYFSRISNGSGFACGLTVYGQAYCWGGNRFGQLGIGNTTNTNTPTLVAPAN